MSQLSRCKLTRVRKTVEETVWKDVLTTICRSEDLTVPPLVGCCRWNRWLLFVMIRSVVKSFKVPDVDVAAALMSNESALTRMTDSTPKNLGQTPRWSWMDELTPICQMKDLLLGCSTTCRRESLAPLTSDLTPKRYLRPVRIY